MILTLGRYQVRAIIDILLPIDVRALGNVPIGFFLQYEWQCLVTVYQDASLTNLNASIEEVVPSNFEGYVSDPWENLVNQVSLNFVRDFGEDLKHAILLQLYYSYAVK